ncbi:MAG: GMC family oxidoreductase, partial [Myxococcota bacterium]
LPDSANRIRLDDRFLDPLGVPRPAIEYRIDHYTLAGMAQAKRVAKAIFSKAGIEDHSDTGGGKWFPSVQFEGETFHYHGMGHFAGTHLMGDSSRTSVVDHAQRCWGHNNLYMIGSGSFPTMGTSNPTLTIAALAIRTADHIVSELKTGSFDRS